ncbi:hypothetical protein Tcan_05948 [Toxocara canis]|uniref:Endonuclease/exonuclease/phosphatase domain-containing protein n=1 Tax=Toxocara canis TaxID=6265 RepID=A0A0B2VJ30_TOXCA|nr:hypothetical protein Tcan_05948 [Toxocara canis]
MALGMDSETYAKLRADIRADLREEIMAEVRQQLIPMVRALVQEVMDSVKSTVAATQFDQDIIGLCETWLSDKIPDSLLSLNSKYNVLRSDRSCSMKGGGVAILAKRHLSFEGTETLALNSGCELVSADFSCANAYHFRFIVAYRRPECSVQETREFFDCLTNWCCVVHTTIIVGDFNIPLSRTRSYNVDMLTDFLAECGLVSLIDESTRENSLLDLLLSIDAALINNPRVTPNFGTSDHCSISLKLLGPLDQL